VIRTPAAWMKPGRRRRATAREEFWALRDVNLEIKQGEVVGIIGRNGAGKSTLLKILSRITDPTKGRIRLRGRVACLLEVGTGFHPELTGSENVFLNGAILGMSRLEIKRKFDEIVAFAEVERFLDTPVKRYSSGMYVRLAFAVAAHLEPEILIVDEVLAVGDASFQRKCLGKLGEVSKEGRTVLMVSHNMTSISQLCNETIWIESGRLRLRGPTKAVISEYLTSGSHVDGRVVWETGIANPDVDEFKLLSVCIRNDDRQVATVLDVQKEFFVELEYKVTVPLPHCRVGFTLTNIEGIHIFQAYDSDIEETPGPREPGRFVARCTIPGNLLIPGRYIASVNAGMVNIKNLVHLDSILVFDIEETGSAGSAYGRARMGIIRPKLTWDIEIETRGNIELRGETFLTQTEEVPAA
jgi:lipopolysaccharide transport system ATP-binding protein